MINLVNNISNIGGMYSLQSVAAASKNGGKAISGKTLESGDLSSGYVTTQSKNLNSTNVQSGNINNVDNSIPAFQPESGSVDVSYTLQKMREKTIQNQTEAFMNKVKETQTTNQKAELYEKDALVSSNPFANAGSNGLTLGGVVASKNENVGAVPSAIDQMLSKANSNNNSSTIASLEQTTFGKVLSTVQSNYNNGNSSKDLYSSDKNKYNVSKQLSAYNLMQNAVENKTFINIVV